MKIVLKIATVKIVMNSATVLYELRFPCEDCCCKLVNNDRRMKTHVFYLPEE